MSRPIIRILQLALAVLLSSGTLLLPTGAASAEGTTSPVGYAGNAYGTKVKIGSTVKSGPTANVTMGCTTIAGQTKQNNTATTSVPGLVSTGTTVNTLKSLADGSTSTMSASSDVQNVSLLAGLITLDALHAVSNTSWNGTSFSSTGGTTFVNLRIAGKSITASPAPNTKINLAGLGYVVLNQQIKKAPKGKPTQSFTVNAVHVVVNQQNVLGLKLGTDIIIGSATSTLNAPIAGVMNGAAYGTTASLLGLIKHGRTANQTLPCLGTDGAVLDNTTAGVSLPGLNTGTVYSTAQGTVSASTMSARLTNTIQSINLAGGLVTVSAVHSAVKGDRPTGGAANLVDDGSHFVNLHIDGFPAIDDSVAPNTKLELPGLGTLWLHRVLRPNDHTIEVRMIELQVTADGASLAKGTSIIVSSSRLSLGE